MGFVWIWIGSSFWYLWMRNITSWFHAEHNISWLSDDLSPWIYLFCTYLTREIYDKKKKDRPRCQVPSFQYVKQAVSVAEEVSLKNDKRSISVIEYNTEPSKWSTEHGIFSGQVHVLKFSLGEKMNTYQFGVLTNVFVPFSSARLTEITIHSATTFDVWIQFIDQPVAQTFPRTLL